MDLDDLDEPTQAPSRTSRFAPKSKFQPKSRQLAKREPKPEQAAMLDATARSTTPVLVVKKEENSNSLFSTAKMDLDEGPLTRNNDFELKEEAEKVPLDGDAMEEDGKDGVVEEDYVVAEYDVYFTPGDADNQLYVLQYPLRPSWRPYELDQRCTEVRVKPKSAEVEVDLLMDTDSYNYDPDAPTAEKMKKQILSSLWKQPQASGYAVGVLTDKKLYLNPVHAVVQLRTSMEYLDSGASKKKNAPDIAVKTEGSGSAVHAGSSRKQSQEVHPEELEPWVPLKYHSSTSDLSGRYLRRMMTAENNPLEFPMNPYDYLNSLCPGTAINKMKSKGPSRRYLLSLALEERLKTWLVEGPPVQHFNAIKHLAPDDPVQDVLQILQRYARLVQGLWVPNTKIRHPNAKGPEQLIRDYALLLFSRSPVIKYTEFDVLGSHKSGVKAVLREIAVDRTYCEDWKFKESTDVSFIKQYPDVAEQQTKLWQEAEKKIGILDLRRKPGASRESSRSGKTVMPESSIHSGEVSVKAGSAAHLGRMSMSKETREALPKVLRKLFQTHKVCSFQTICQGLRDMAVSMSSLPKADARAAVAAALSVDGPLEELQAVISEVAVNVHGVYILKSSEHQELDPLRNVVIEMFLGTGRSAKLKKSEVIEAAKIKLQKEPTNTEFQKVMTEMCVSQGGAWILRSGDGVPK